jgi:hypothetical protein
MRTSSTASVVSRRTALAGFGAGALGLALATRRIAAFAQDATPAAAPPRKGHPLVGAWEVTESDEQPVPAAATYAIFDADGTWLHYGGRSLYGGVGFLAIGAWRPTGARTAEAIEIYEQLNAFDRLLDLASPIPDDALVQPDFKFRFDAEVDASGNTFRTEGFVVDEQGKDDPAYWGTRVGVRLVRAAGLATPTA